MFTGHLFECYTFPYIGAERSREYVTRRLIEWQQRHSSFSDDAIVSLMGVLEVFPDELFEGRPFYFTIEPAKRSHHKDKCPITITMSAWCNFSYPRLVATKDSIMVTTDLLRTGEIPKLISANRLHEKDGTLREPLQDYVTAVMMGDL